MSELEEEQVEQIPQYVNQHLNSNLASAMNTEATIRYHTDPNEIIEEIEHILKNEFLKIDPETGAESYEVKPDAVPLISDDGLQTLMVILRFKLTKIFSLTDLEAHEIENMVQDDGANILAYIVDNWGELGIPSTSHASIISNTIIDAIIANLKKSYQGKLLDHMKTVQRINETNVISQQNRDLGQERPSMFRRMMPKWLR